ncbi:FKBP-type peptidyl-prolyl cis-trans isomerase [Psychrobacter sp. BF1]|uniref:FKBP-type peptidyl-prolyl cis-trans isomerase n=1 Tax=Psychrobacter TaxID=497 RepID=UPI001C4DF431|nr:FKBP-type peptidyl-prolyl cis-trans isomerase [Psychrobacter sp. BF1]
MKKITTLTFSVLASAMLLTGCNTNTKETAAASISVTEQSTAEQKVGYSLGYMMAEGNKESIADLDIDTFEKGFRDGYEGSKSALTKEQMEKVLTDYQKVQEEKFVKDMATKTAENKTKGAAFLAENAKKEGVKVTASGLQYKVLTPGTGKSPKATDVVEVNYEGKLIDGTVFDSSYERGEPVEFPLNQVIAGWTEGVQLMKEGAKYEFYIPSDIAYGEAGNQGIDPNSTLVFVVELLKVK